MSLEDLRHDLVANLKESRGIADPATRQHLAETLWPFLEALVDIVEEIDDAVGELVHQQEDYLQPNTAAVFVAVIQSSLALAGDLKARAAGDPDISRRITEHEQLCEAAAAILGDITMVPEGDEDEDEEQDEESNSEQ